MGEAKRRGSFSERKAQSIAKKKSEIEGMISDLIARKKSLYDQEEKLTLYQEYKKSKINHQLRDLQAYYSRTYEQKVEA